MSEHVTNHSDGVDSSMPTDTEASAEPVDVEKLIAERAKWMHFAREHENKWRRLSKEFEAFKQAQMTEAERAVEAARAEGRQAAAQEYRELLTAAELEKLAVKSNVALPDSKFINLAALMNDDGPNGEAIEAFIATLPKNGFPQEVIGNAGNREGSGPVKPKQLTYADLQGMSYEEINRARMAGQLNDLLGIS